MPQEKKNKVKRVTVCSGEGKSKRANLERIIMEIFSAKMILEHKHL